MASKARLISTNPTYGIIIEVTHLAGDSYSRSVYRAADKMWRTIPGSGRFPCRRSILSIEHEGADSAGVHPQDKSTSIFAYSTTIRDAFYMLEPWRVNLHPKHWLKNQEI